MNISPGRSILLFCAALALAAAGRAQVNFTLTDLGDLGGTATKAFGLNNSNTVVGASAPSGATPYYAYTYSGGSMTSLGLAGGSGVSEAHAINDSGVIIGQSSVTGGQNHAFSYTTGGGYVDLLTMGGIVSNATSINASGVIVGSSGIGGGVTRAFRLTSGTLSIANSLGTTGGTNSTAFDINATGVIVGQSQMSGDATTQAFVLTSGTLSSGHAIGALGTGANSTAFAINDAGMVVGQSEYASGSGNLHAFSYTSGGGFVDLNTLGGTNSIARDVNSSNYIVGTSQVSGGAYHAFFYDGTTMYDLNDWVSGASGWVLQDAWAINAAGVIVGSGTFGGETRAFMLTAVPEPSTYAALAGLAALGLAMSRRRGQFAATRRP